MLKKNYAQAAPLCRVTFTLPIEAVSGGEEVRLVGEFNGWRWEAGYRMRPGDGEFITEVDLPTGRDYQFRYLIDDRVWVNHWQADAYVPTPFGAENSVVSLRGAAVTPPSTPDSPPVATSTGQLDAPVHARRCVDDLTKIEGIGPKIAGILQAAGILTFADLAAATQDRLASILKAAGKRYQMHDPTTWPKQAQFAARSDWRKLEDFQLRLIRGSRP